jgi:hypothetical protein
MKKYSIVLLIMKFCLLEQVFCLFIFMTADKSCAVPAIPNESVVIGVVKEYAIVSSILMNIQPEQTIYRMTIHIESSQGLDNSPNFLKDKEGKDVQLFSKERISPELFGKRLKAKVTYQGDERGGLFWIKSFEIIN